MPETRASNDKEDEAFTDCPGFLDNRGPVINIASKDGAQGADNVLLLLVVVGIVGHYGLECGVRSGHDAIMAETVAEADEAVVWNLLHPSSELVAGRFAAACIESMAEDETSSLGPRDMTKRRDKVGPDQNAVQEKEYDIGNEEA